MGSTAATLSSALAINVDGQPTNPRPVAPAGWLMASQLPRRDPQGHGTTGDDEGGGTRPGHGEPSTVRSPAERSPSRQGKEKARGSQRGDKRQAHAKGPTAGQVHHGDVLVGP